MTVPSRSLQALSRTTLLVRRDIFPALDDMTIAEALTTTRVQLVARPSVCRSENGQTAIVTTAILCMQLGIEVALNFPEAALIAAQPPLRGEGLRESLLELSEQLITPALHSATGDLAISIGRDVAGPGVAMSGDDWGFALHPSPTGSHGFSGRLPFGPALGAVAAAAETFRYVMHGLADRTGVDPLPEHPIREPRAASQALPRFNCRAGDLGRVDSVSAGALTTSALYLLLRVPGLRMGLRLIDNDYGAVSNLNRYPLLFEQMLRIPKVDALHSYATEAISIEPVPIRFDDETIAAIGRLAPRLIIGVDDIPSRWRAQSVAEGWVGVAATSHFEAVISEHTPESPCASCLHPHDAPGPVEDIPTVSFVSAAAGFLLAHRLVRSGCSDATPSQTLAYPFNLSGQRPIWELPLSPHPECKVNCALSAQHRKSETPLALAPRESRPRITR